MSSSKGEQAKAKFGRATSGGRIRSKLFSGHHQSLSKSAVKSLSVHIFNETTHPILHRLGNGSLSRSLPMGHAVRLRRRILYGRHRWFALAWHQRLPKFTLRRAKDRHDHGDKSKSTCDRREFWSVGWHGKPQWDTSCHVAKSWCSSARLTAPLRASGKRRIPTILSSPASLQVARWL